MIAANFLPLAAVAAGLVVLGLAQIFHAPAKVLWVSSAALGGWSALAFSLFPGGHAFWVPTAILAVVSLLLLSLRSPRLLELLRKPGFHGTCLLLCGPGFLLAVLPWADQNREAPRARKLRPGPLALTLRQQQYRPVTDKGTPVPVIHAQRNRDFEDDSDRIRQWAESASLMRTGPADASYNCHGWVFCGGLAYLDGSPVEQILLENGYERVEEPMAGDVIVYYGGGGIAHTGLVRLVVDEELVVIESKWSWHGRFLHAATESPFGSDYCYYRSLRNGHRLRDASDELLSSVAD